MANRIGRVFCVRQAKLNVCLYKQVQDTEVVRTQLSKGVAMPFNVNNVDVTVAANVVYGITMVALTNVTDDPVALIDTDVEVSYFVVQQISLFFFSACY